MTPILFPLLAMLLSGFLHPAAAAEGAQPDIASPKPKVSVATGPVTRTPSRPGAHWETRRLSTTVDGKRADVEVFHLRGFDGIEAADIPESAKAFLLTHAKTLPPDDVAHYVVNKKQIEEWARTHPMPETLKKKKETHRKRGCNSISMKCAKEGVKHVSKEVSKQTEALRQEARREWDDVSREVGRGLKMAEGALRECFADHPVKSGPIRVPPLDIPTKVRVAGAAVKDKRGKVDGRANISLPMRLTDATVEVSAFIIPCAITVPQLPIWIRPRSVSLEGVLTVDSTLDLELNANGTVRERIELKAPPEMDFFTTVFFIHSVPVELDLGVGFEAQVDIEASGIMHAKLCDVRQRKVRLDFECDGKGCRGQQRELPVQFQPIRDLQVTAQGHGVVRPAVLTAFTLDVNFGALSARVGPEFYVSAEVRGGARTGSAGTRGPGSIATAAALSADLYGGVDILYFVNFLRPEFADGKSAAQVVKGRNPWIKRPLLESISVGSPSATAQSSQPGSASPRCAK